MFCHLLHRLFICRRYLSVVEGNICTVWGGNIPWRTPVRAKGKVRLWVLFHSKFLPKLSGRGTSLLPQLWCWASGCPQPWPAPLGGEELPSLCLLPAASEKDAPCAWKYRFHGSDLPSSNPSLLCSVFSCSSCCFPRAHEETGLVPVAAWTLKHFGLVGIKLFVWVPERGKQSRYLARGGKGMLLMKAVFLLQ